MKTMNRESVKWFKKFVTGCTTLERVNAWDETTFFTLHLHYYCQFLYFPGASDSTLEQAMKTQGRNTDPFTRSRFGSTKPDDSNSPLPFHYPASIGNIK